jgi:hypothetical protein
MRLSPGLTALSTCVASSYTADLEHAGGTEEERDDPAEQRGQQEIEAERNRPRKAKEPCSCVGQILENEDKHQNEQ